MQILFSGNKKDLFTFLSIIEKYDSKNRPIVKAVCRSKVIDFSYSDGTNTQVVID